MEPISSQNTSPLIAYLGPQASFSHQAALEAFPGIDSSRFLPLPSFQSILSEVQRPSSASATQDESDPSRRIIDYALLPFENSTNGGVVQVLDLLVQSGLQSMPCMYPDIEIVAEHYLRVHHCLFVDKSVISDPQSANGFHTSEAPDRQIEFDFESLRIKALYSHPQVWGQCTKFLNANFPSWQVQYKDVSSTSAAAAFVSKNPSSPSSDEDSKPQSAVAKELQSSNQGETKPKITSSSSSNSNNGAICSSLAGKQNDLVCVAANIEDEPGKNTTRFLVIRNRSRASQNSMAQEAHARTSNSTSSSLSSSSSTTMPMTTMTATLATPSIPENQINLPQVLYSQGNSYQDPGSQPSVLFCKSLITFTIPHKTPGSLASALTVFQKHGLNLTSITTRPSKGQPWHYVFFVEFEFESEFKSKFEFEVDAQHAASDEQSVGFENDKLQAMLAEMSQVTERNTLLGSWIDRLKHPT